MFALDRVLRVVFSFLAGVVVTRFVVQQGARNLSCDDNNSARPSYSYQSNVSPGAASPVVLTTTAAVRQRSLPPASAPTRPLGTASPVVLTTTAAVRQRSLPPAPAPTRPLQRRASPQLSTTKQPSSTLVQSFRDAGKLQPSILMIGQQKCGTTLLFTQLMAHPNISAPTKKELWYLIRRRDLRAYLDSFPPLESGKLTIDSTIDLLAHGDADYVHSQLPAAKLLVVLCDPVSRAWSEFQMRCRQGRLSPSLCTNSKFRDDVSQQIATIRRLWRSKKNLFPAPKTHALWVWRGLYAEQIKPWLRVFPRRAVHVVALEQYVAQPDKTMRQLTSFLELPSFTPPPLRHILPVGSPNHTAPHDYEQLWKSTANELRKFFAAENQKLYAMLPSFTWRWGEANTEGK